MGTQYMICRWAINRSDPQNLLSVTLDVPLHLFCLCHMVQCLLLVILGHFVDYRSVAIVLYA